MSVISELNMIFPIVWIWKLHDNEGNTARTYTIIRHFHPQNVFFQSILDSCVKRFVWHSFVKAIILFPLWYDTRWFNAFVISNIKMTRFIAEVSLCQFTWTFHSMHVLYGTAICWAMTKIRRWDAINITMSPRWINYYFLSDELNWILKHKHLTITITILLFIVHFWT